jgi:hypothetical protein
LTSSAAVEYGRNHKEIATNSYQVDVDVDDRDSVIASCHALIEVMRPVLHDGLINERSDSPDDNLDTAALRAQEEIRERAAMEVEAYKGLAPQTGYCTLDLTRDDDLDILRGFGPWSALAMIYSTQRASRLHDYVLCFSKGGWDITAELTNDEATSVTSLLPPGAKLIQAEPRLSRTRGVWFTKRKVGQDGFDENIERVLEDELARVAKIWPFSAGARFAARRMPSNVFEGVVEVLADPADVYERFRAVVESLGRLLERDPDSPSLTLTGLIGTALMNPAVVEVQITPLEVGWCRATVTGTAKEGLIRQRSGEKAGLLVLKAFGLPFVVIDSSYQGESHRGLSGDQ